MMNAKFYGDLLNDYVKAGSQSLPAEVLEALAHSEIDCIRLRVAENPKTPIDILELLSTDKNADVRIAVGTNNSTPPYITFKLAQDEDPNVRLGLADDINTPIELLEKLSEDENPWVSSRAVETIRIIQSQGSPRSIGRVLCKWAARGFDHPELKYA
jgi:hypothetical protein